MKKTLLLLTLVSAFPVAPVKAAWQDYVPFWNSTKSEGRENVALTEKEQLTQSAKKYACIAAGLLALHIVLDHTPIIHYLDKYFENGLIRLYNALCSDQIYRIGQNPVLYLTEIEFRRTLWSIEQLSKIASIACFWKAGYDLTKAQFVQSNATQEIINS